MDPIEDGRIWHDAHGSGLASSSADPGEVSAYRGRAQQCGEWLSPVSPEDSERGDPCDEQDSEGKNPCEALPWCAV